MTAAAYTHRQDWQTGQFGSVQLASIWSGIKAKRWTWVPGDGHIPPLTGWSRSHWSPGWPAWVWACSWDGQPVGNGGSACSAAGSPGTAGRNDVPSPPPGGRNPLLLPLRSQQRWQAVFWSEPREIGGSGSCLLLGPLGRAAAGGTPPWLRP